MINLQEFIDGYKTCEITLGDKRWVFREPKIKDTKLTFLQILEKYCMEGDWLEFKKVIDTELPVSKQKEVLELLIKELGLA